MHIRTALPPVLLGLMLCAPVVHAGRTKARHAPKATFLNLWKYRTSQGKALLFRGVKKDGGKKLITTVPADTSLVVFGRSGRVSAQSWRNPGRGWATGAMLFSKGKKSAQVGFLSSDTSKLRWGTLLDAKALGRKHAVRDLIKRSGIKNASISFEKVTMGFRFSKILDKPRPTVQVVAKISGTRNGKRVTRTFRGDAEVRGNPNKGMAGISVGAFTEQRP